MDDRRLDNLAKLLAHPISRRGAIKAVAAAALGGLLGELRLTGVDARQSGFVDCSRRPLAACCAYCQTLFPANPSAALLCYAEGLLSQGHGGPCGCQSTGGTVCPTNPAQSAAFTCCPAPSACHVSTCLAAVCGTAAATNGTACTLSSGSGTCQSGTCTSSIGSCFACPPEDLAGRPIQQSVSSTEIFCRYQSVPNDFFCKYFVNTGLLKQDHDEGFCPPVASISTCA